MAHGSGLFFKKLNDPSSILKEMTNPYKTKLAGVGLALCLAPLLNLSAGAGAPNTEAATPSQKLKSEALILETGEPKKGDLEHLAKELSNPVSSLISVPIQQNFDFGYANNGWRSTTNIQPVIPVQITKDWNIISRTILPIVYQENVIGKTNQGGLSDLTQSFFLSPQKPGPGGIVWGVGPVFLLPTATDNLLGTEKWGAGPTLVLLKQSHGWTYGVLANHINSFAGDDNRAYVASTFIQPFLAYTTKHSTTFTINSESTYDWRSDQWTVPFNLMVSQLFKIGNQPVSFQVGARAYADTPNGGPDWGLRCSFTFLFPEK